MVIIGEYKVNLEKNKDSKIKQEIIVEAKKMLEDYMYNWDTYSGNYAQTLINTLNGMHYQPTLGNQYTKDINIGIEIPNQSTLKEWLKYPEHYESQLRGISQYFENVIMQYNRTVNYFARILLFLYDLRPITEIPKDKVGVDRWKWGYSRCKEFLRKFNLQNQKNAIIQKTIDEGGYFGYLVENKDIITLVEIPTDYCYITGKCDIGWTFAVDLTWFDNIANQKSAIPELYDYYRKFMEARAAYERQELGYQDLIKYQYYPVPIEKGFVFSFDILRGRIVPPFIGLFKDALSIVEYKDLLKAKTQLDTWKMVAQIIPKDKDNKMTIPATVAAKFVAESQKVMPSGAITFATPMDVKELSFNNSQSQNNITGLGESLYWRSAGVNGVIMDSGDKTAQAIKVGVENDYGFVQHIYNQFENFINLQFRLISREHKFRIKIYGNKYTHTEDTKLYSELVSKNNMPVGQLFGYIGLEPYEIDPVLDMEKLLGWKEKLEPILSAFNTKGIGSSNTGAPKKETSESTDSGNNQRDYDSNNTKSEA